MLRRNFGEAFFLCRRQKNMENLFIVNGNAQITGNLILFFIFAQFLQNGKVFKRRHIARDGSARSEFA